MWHEVRLGREFFAQLLAIDAAAAARTRSAGCGACGGPVCVGHFERKPRGGLLAAAGEEAMFTQRFSYCCSREGCRKRATPPSVRFLGRKVHLEGAILIACVLAPLLDDRARSIRAATGIAARMVRRWQSWWRTRVCWPGHRLPNRSEFASSRCSVPNHPAAAPPNPSPGPSRSCRRRRPFYSPGESRPSGRDNCAAPSRSASSYWYTAFAPTPRAPFARPAPVRQSILR